MSGKSLLFFLFALGSCLVSCQKQDPVDHPASLSGLTMGTSYEIRINHQLEETDLAAIQDAIDIELESINKSMSTYLPGSELSKINNAPTAKWLPLTIPLYNVLYAAIQINRDSIGYFDITVGPLVNLWGFGPEINTVRVPDENTINNVMNSVGMNKLLLDTNNGTLQKTAENMYLDLSGIAKGYAVDMLGKILKDRFNLENFMIEIGGEIKAAGHNPDGIAWQIGIEQPSGLRSDITSVVSLTNTSLATSGDYRNYFEVNEEHYSHTIDPATGKPVTHNLTAVTVIHEQCMLADAWSTGLLAAGPDIGVQLANMNNLAAHFTIREKDNFTYISTKAFRKYVDDQ